MRPICCLLATATLAVCPTAFSQTFHPNIPRTWATKDVADTEVPLAQPDRSPRYLSEQEYYALKVRPIYRSYPVYAEGREPAGYIQSLMQKEPEIIFDPSKLKTKEDWIRAGKIVFEADNSFFPPVTPAPGGNKVFADRARWVSSDGVIRGFAPRTSYVIRKKAS